MRWSKIKEDISELVDINMVLSYKDSYERQKFIKHIMYFMQMYLISFYCVFNSLPIKNGKTYWQ